MNDGKPRCCKTVYGSGMGFRGSSCSNPGKEQVGDKWFCRIHSPSGEIKRKERQAIRDADLNTKWERERAERRYAADAVARCRELGIVNPLLEIAKVQP